MGRYVRRDKSRDYAFKREALSDMKGEVYWKLIPLARSLSSFSFFHLLKTTVNESTLFKMKILVFTFCEETGILNDLPHFLGPAK